MDISEFYSPTESQNARILIKKFKLSILNDKIDELSSFSSQIPTAKYSKRINSNVLLFFNKNLIVTKQCVRMTLLHWCVINNSFRSLEFILKVGALPCIANSLGEFPIETCIQLNYYSCLRQLIKYSSNSRSLCPREYNPFLTVCKLGYIESLKILISSSLMIEHSNNVLESNTTLLHIAASNGHLGIIQILIKHGANCNILDGDGNTVLHSAAESGSIDCIKYLIKQEYTHDMIKSVNNFGERPKDLAIKNLHEECVMFFANLTKFNVRILNDLHSQPIDSVQVNGDNLRIKDNNLNDGDVDSDDCSSRYPNSKPLTENENFVTNDEI